MVVAVDMVIDVSEFEDYMRGLEERVARGGGPIHDQVWTEIRIQNRGIRYKRGHKDTIFEQAGPWTWTIGSRQYQYGMMLNASPALVMDIVGRWIVDGASSKPRKYRGQ